MNKCAQNTGLRTATLAAVASLVLTLGLAPVAHAEDNIDNIASVAADAMSTQDVVPGQQIGDAVVVEGDSATTAVTAAGAAELVLTGESGVPIPIDLPGDGAGSKVSLSDSGVAVVPDAGEAMHLVVQGLNNGVRVEAVLQSSDASGELEFGFGDDTRLSLNRNGSVDVFVSRGGAEMAVAHIEAPWARDAEGSAVATRYQVKGSTLVQIVDLEATGIVFPVVADPKFQSDCGIVTCTLRLDRATTKWLGSHPSERDLALGLGCVVAGGLGGAWGAGICAVVALAVIYQASKAAEYYNNGKCYGYRWFVAEPALGVPITINVGKYNCK